MNQTKIKSDNLTKAAAFVKRLPRAAAEKLNGIVNRNRQSFVLILISSLVMNVLLEAALRKSIPKAMKLIFSSPVNFFYNSLLILAFYSLIYLVKRRMFVYELVTILWGATAIVSRCLMSFRTTPFNASDFRVLQSAFTIIPIYLDVWEIIGVALLVTVCIALLIASFIKCKRTERLVRASAMITAAVVFAASAATMLYLEFHLDSDHFSNLPTAYKKNGFCICFLCSIFDHGIDKPKNYSVQTVENMVESLEKSVDENATENVVPQNSAVNERPNIIFLQLESFYDVNKIEGYTYSENPIPVFTKLKETNPHGLFRVPSIGAGTANTEFEVLTGMEVSYFGVAEYPYLSVLQDNTCESVCFNLKNHGYTAHAIHNHKGTFYDRNKVFPNLGFDTFTSLESMPDIQRNRRNWAKDSMLTSEIIRALDSTPDGRDLIYTISVQPHGRYPSSWESYEKLLDGEQPHITVSGNEDNPESAGFAYYVNELHECDTFIGSLLSEIINRGEPTVLIMYGDHLPAFTVQGWTLTDGDYYTTDYVIWNNCGIDFSDASELTSYQISAYVLGKLGITDGNMNKLNQSFIGTDTDYSADRELLEYDLLYGDKAASGGESAYSPTEIKFGLAEIEITGMTAIDGVTYVKGNNFNEFSTVTVNGRIESTSFADKNTLVLDTVPQAGDEIGVVQLAGNHTVLGQSANTVIFEEAMLQDSAAGYSPPVSETSEVYENNARTPEQSEVEADEGTAALQN